MKTEIDPLQPKVTVLGNVDPQVLIKKLLKVGKQPETWSYGNQNAGKEKKEATAVTNEKGKQKTGCDQQAKCPDSKDKIRESTDGDGGDGNKNIAVKKDQSEMEGTVQVIKNEIPPKPHPEVNCTEYPSLLHDRANVKSLSHTQCYYMVAPSVITLPYHAHMVPPLLPINCYGEEYYNYGRPISQPPATRIGDYFSDENTVGCHVM